MLSILPVFINTLLAAPVDAYGIAGLLVRQGRLTRLLSGT
jgi:hypothetical protein